MKKVLLLGVMFSLFFFSCKASVDSDSQQELSPENDTPIPQQTQETYVEIINNSVYPIDLYSSPARNDEYSLIGANIAPKNNYKILVTDKSKELVYYVVFHIRIAELDVPYWDNDSVLIIAVRKGELSKAKVSNPIIDVGHVSWLILENRSPFGLRLVKNSLELVPENKSEESSLLNTEEFGVYKVYASEFNNLKIKKASNSVGIEFPIEEIESGKIYKLVVDDDLKCSLESTYSFNNSTIVYQYPENYQGEKITEKSVVIGETLTAEKHLPTLPSEIGYVFDGWYNGDQLITEGYIIQSDITLTAKWKLIHYKIEYELNGGENNPENSRTSYTIKDILDTEDSKITIELKNPTRNIDEFSGWYGNENFSGKPVTKITINANSLGDIKVYAKWIDKCTVQYETKYGTIPDAAIIKKGEKLTSEQLPELTNGDYIFDGWYIGETKVIAGEYTVTNNVTLTAGWNKCLDESNCVVYQDITKTLAFDFSRYQESGDIGSNLNYFRYSDGVLTIYPIENESVIKKIVFKGAYQTHTEDNHLTDSVISGLCIKFSENWTSTVEVVFENFAFESSKAQPLIDSPVDLLIEYKGNNRFSSSASDAISLIHSKKSIEFKADDSNNTLTIKPNQVTNKDCYQGSIAVEAENRVTIDGGTFIIERGDGWNNDEEGRIGGDGSSGIKATETVIKNNAVVNITSGDGANGNDGKDNSGVISAKGANTTGTYQTAGKGDSGIPGGDAGNGGNGGTAITGKLTVVSGNIILSGGKGGDGGTGGQGGHGGQGGDNGWVGGTNGDGGDGGKGGKAGRGGNGGDAINGQFENQNHCLVKLFEGKCGENGTPGIGGIEGGRGWHYNVGGTFGHHGCSGAPGERGDPADDPPPCDGVQHR